MTNWLLNMLKAEAERNGLQGFNVTQNGILSNPSAEFSPRGPGIPSITNSVTTGDNGNVMGRGPNGPVITRPNNPTGDPTGTNPIDRGDPTKPPVITPPLPPGTNPPGTNPLVDPRPPGNPPPPPSDNPIRRGMEFTGFSGNINTPLSNPSGTPANFANSRIGQNSPYMSRTERTGANNPPLFGRNAAGISTHNGEEIVGYGGAANVSRRGNQITNPKNDRQSGETSNNPNQNPNIIPPPVNSSTDEVNLYLANIRGSRTARAGNVETDPYVPYHVMEQQGLVNDRYHHRVNTPTSEAGDPYRYELKPEWHQYIRNNYGQNLEQIGGGTNFIQVSEQHNGRSGMYTIIDPSKVVWDDEFGLITGNGNLRWDTRHGDTLFALAAAGLTGPTLFHALGGLGAGAGGAGAETTVGGGTTTGGGAVTGGGAAEIVGGGATSLNPFAGATGEITGGGLNLGNTFRLGRTALSAGNFIRSFLNRNGDRTGGGNGNGDGDNLMNNPLLNGLLGVGENQLDRRSINEYRDFVNDLLTRGDWNSRHRPAQLDQLQRTFTNPQEFLNDPSYVAMRDRASDDLSRRMSARGLGLSGNELGDLTRLRTEMDYKHLGDLRSQLVSSASMGNPTGMYGSALRNADTLLQARSNQNAGLTRNIRNLLSDLFSGNGPPDLRRLPREIYDRVVEWADKFGMTPEEYLREVHRTDRWDLDDNYNQYNQDNLDDIDQYGPDYDDGSGWIDDEYWGF